MHPLAAVDTGFDVRSDARGRDPDAHSPTLRSYHQLLWSKPLPDGTVFDLDTTHQSYLHHQSHRGEFWLSSDSIVHTYSYWSSMRTIIDQCRADDITAFDTVASTVGATLIFPSNRVDGKATINVARGFNSQIRDRIDLTLECIRRHYAGAESPLGEALERYRAFFAVFESFEDYIRFFLLEDLTKSATTVRFLLPFDDFRRPAVPTDAAEYGEFMNRSMTFVRARNERIDRWVAAQLG